MIRTEIIELPLSVKGCVCELGKDEFLILINKLLPEETQREALEHEETHIKLKHFDRDRSVEECEREVRQIVGR